MKQAPVTVLFGQLAECASRFDTHEAEAAASLLLATFSIKNGHQLVEATHLLAESMRMVREMTR